MYQRIMVAIDESSSTGKVIDAAIAIAQKFGANLAICHALDERILSRHEPDVMLPSSVGQVKENLRSGAYEFMEKAASVARQAGIEVEIQLIESEGQKVAEMLADAAQAWKADLLVIGAHDQHGVERFFASTLAEQLARRPKTSLLLAHST